MERLQTKENRIGSVWWSSLAKAIDGWWTRFHFRLWLEKALSRGVGGKGASFVCFFFLDDRRFFFLAEIERSRSIARRPPASAESMAPMKMRSHFFLMKKNERQDRYSFTSLNQKSERRFSLFPSSLSNQMSIKVRSCWKLRWKSSLIKRNLVNKPEHMWIKFHPVEQKL